MPSIRFHDRLKGTQETLKADSFRQAKQLFDYAVSCATANMRIELVVNGQIVRTHWVDYVDNEPSVRDMPRYAA